MTSSIRLNKILLMLADIAVYIIAFALSFYLRYGADLPDRNMKEFYFMLPWFILVFMILLKLYNLYSIYIKYDEIFASLVCIVVFTDIINVSMSFLFRQFAVPRSIFLISGIMQLLLLGIWRYFVWRKGLLIRNPKKALIIGYPGEIKQLLNSVNISLGKGLQIAREIRLNSKDNFEKNWAGYISSAIAGEIEVILICSSVGQYERNIILSYAIDSRKIIMLVPGVYEILLQQAKMVSAGDVPIIQLQGILAEYKPEMLKRFMDMIISLVALLVSMPLTIFIALAIKIDNPGSVFYAQQRIGLRGKVFNVYKFRTMVMDAEIMSGPVLSDQGDHRITRIGRFLRQTRLDEIPQFFNILKGDMSLVGPRPERPFFIEEFKEKLPEFDYRHKIMCGLTGLAQVEGNYSTNPSNKLSYDLYYAQKKSIMMDIVILLRTVRVMLQKRKAS